MAGIDTGGGVTEEIVSAEAITIDSEFHLWCVLKWETKYIVVYYAVSIVHIEGTFMHNLILKCNYQTQWCHLCGTLQQL